MAMGPTTAFDLLRAVLCAQNGHIPMKPLDRGNALLALEDLQAEFDRLQRRVAGMAPPAVTVGPFTTGGVVIQFPHRSH